MNCTPRWLDNLRDDWRKSSVLENRKDYFRYLLLGARPTLRFRGGFSVPGEVADLHRIKRLVALAYFGADLTSDSTRLGRDWFVDLPKKLIVTPSGIRFDLDSVNPVIFAETFIHDVHFQGYDLRERIVIDVGANVGDTALYYASRGARVMAYEPDPENYRRLEQNLALNPQYAPRIIPHRVAVGERGEVTFHAGLGGASGLHATGGQTIRLPSRSLADLINEIEPARAYLLKADCKGCEETLVTQAELAQFDHVRIEYDRARPSPYPESLEAALRSHGFQWIRRFKHNCGEYTLNTKGIIVASH